MYIFTFLVGSKYILNLCGTFTSHWEVWESCKWSEWDNYVFGWKGLKLLKHIALQSAYGSLRFHWDILFCKITRNFYCFNCKTCVQGERRGTTYHLLYLQLRKPLKMSLSELMWWRLSRIMTAGRSAPLLSALHCSAKFARYCRRSFSRINKKPKTKSQKNAPSPEKINPIRP